jgi:cob(I)alamin adenosyltransferase
LKTLQDNLEGLGTRTALLSAREELSHELSSVRLKERRAGELLAALGEKVQQRKRKIESRGFEKTSVARIKRLVNSAYARLRELQQNVVVGGDPPTSMRTAGQSALTVVGVTL